MEIALSYYYLVSYFPFFRVVSNARNAPLRFSFFIFYLFLFFIFLFLDTQRVRGRSRVNTWHWGYKGYGTQ